MDIDKTEIRYNSEWFKEMKFTDVITLASKMTVARMMERDDFSKRYTSESSHKPPRIYLSINAGI